MTRYFGHFENRTVIKKVSAFWLALLLWAAGAVPEVLLHIASAEKPEDLWNVGLILSVLFALIPALAVCALAITLPWKKACFGICIGYSAVYFVLCASQLVYYRVFGCFYSAFSMTNGGQILQFWNIIVKKIWENLLWFVGMALPLLFLCIRGWREFRFGTIRPVWLASVPVCLAVIGQVALLLCLPLFGGTGDLSPYDLYHSNADAYYGINRLGMLTAFRLDLTRMITDEQVDGNIQLEEPSLDWENPDGTPAPTPSTEPTQPSDPTGETEPTDVEESTQPTEPIPTEPPVDTSPNMLDIDFEALISGETNEAIAELHQYFAGRSTTNKNAYTGLFKGKNLIMITAEAFSYLVIDEELTPTLYKMTTEGFRFSNYYVPDWGTSTTDGEYAFLTGTVPKANVWSFSESSDNAMPLTMSRQLIEQGYNAYAFHGHTYTYYNRNKYLTNLGFYYRGYGGSSDGKTNGLPIDYTWPESDVQVVDVSTSDYVNQTPFVTYYMSISGHREFTFYGNRIAKNNKQYVEHLSYSDNVKAYLACQLELEFSLELLLQRLEEAGVLEDTVIVITADHYPNGLTVEEMSELAGHDIDTDFEIYQNACIIWTPNMEPQVIDKPCSHLDLLPTLSNLFGIDFDSRLYMGRDVFSDGAALVMFRNRNWITDYAMYNYASGEVTSLTGAALSDAYVQAVNQEVSNRFTVSSRVLDYDYWKILFG